MRLKIGFASTRFAGIDGVSLESSKWAKVLADQGHRCFWFAGELDKSERIGLQAGQASFQNERSLWINRQLFRNSKQSMQLAGTIGKLQSEIASSLKLFIDRYRIDLLVVENALAIPMQIPLGLALTDVMAETRIPTIAHHHDFYWERNRYLPLNGSKIYIDRAFPPRLPNIAHVVINSRARVDLKRRKGIVASLIPNVMDFENPPTVDRERICALRQAIGFKSDDIMLLQPTRIIPRKGIESAIELVEALKHPKYKLVVSHEAGDEGFEYARKIKALARRSGVNIRFIDHLVADPFAPPQNSNGRFSLWEVYQAADFITYPSRYEGFGNALVEALYFKKPILVNRFQMFKDDIEPLGLEVVKMDGVLTRNLVADIRNVIEDKYRREEMVAENYRIAAKHFSYARSRRQLEPLISNLFPGGHPVHQAVAKRCGEQLR